MLFVGRLASGVKERDLEEIFTRFGRIKRLNMKGQYAFVTFDDERDAEDALELQGHELHGSRINLEWAKASGRFNPPPRRYSRRSPPRRSYRRSPRRERDRSRSTERRHRSTSRDRKKSKSSRSPRDRSRSNERRRTSPDKKDLKQKSPDRSPRRDRSPKRDRSPRREASPRRDSPRREASPRKEGSPQRDISPRRDRSDGSPNAGAESPKKRESSASPEARYVKS